MSDAHNNRHTPTSELAALTHARALYEELDRLATDEESEGETLRVFRGKYGEVYHSLGIPRVHYTGIRKLLTEGGAITYAQRAARGRSGVVILNRPPSEADAELVPRKVLTTGAGDATMVLVREAAERIARLESWQESFGGMSIPEALRNFEQRIAALESNKRQ